MLLVRELMYCKPGKVKPLVEKFVKMSALMEKAGHMNYCQSPRMRHALFVVAAVTAALYATAAPSGRSTQAAEGEVVTIPSGELLLKGMLFRPSTTAPAPAVLFHHGGGCADVPNAVRAIGPRMAARGYVFLWVYRRGAGLSRGQGECAFEQIPRVRREKGDEAALDLQLQLMTTTELDDAMAGLAALRSIRGVDPSRIAIAGHSFGGQLALLSAARDRGARAVLVFAGAAAIWDRAAKIRTTLLEALGRIGAPVYLGYATDDNDAPGIALGAELSRLRKPHQLSIYPSGGHNFVFSAQHAADAEVFKFLAEHLRAAK